MQQEEVIKLDTTIKDALEYYDKNCEKYESFFKKINYIKKVDNNNSTDDIVFFDIDKNILLKSSYEPLGIYFPKKQLWKWSWSVPTWHKKYTFISRKILEYAFNLDQKKEYLLRSKLINSKIKISNDLQLDIHIAISSYIGKQPLIFKFYNRIFNDFNDDNAKDNDDPELFRYIPDNKDYNEDYMIIYFFILNYEDIKL